MFYSNSTATDENSFVQLVNSSHVRVHEDGYNSTMPLTLVPGSQTVHAREFICGLQPQWDSIRLRWVQYPYGNHGAGEKTVAIDNITVSYWDGVCLRRVVQWNFETEETLPL